MTDNTETASTGPDGPPELLLPSGLEAGTAPDDRAFRPDVEGLRAIAVGVVVLGHAGVRQMVGGLVGVDIFFVISGFVITGLLLRQSEAIGRVEFLAFYARRARRLVPVGILVIVVSLVTAGLVAPHQTAVMTASDSRWSALFLANVHFTVDNRTAYGLPLSPLIHYWSLAVEEQFYLVYPAFFVIVLSIRSAWSGRMKLAIGLTLVIIASLTSSILTSKPQQFVGYYTTYNRAWELALGGLVAVGTDQLRRLPELAATVLSWLGLIAIAISTQVISFDWSYPGYIALLPTLAAVAVIAGGTSVPRWGAEALLATPPFRWIGRWSYSWYLWHFALFFLVTTAFHTNVLRLSNIERIGLILFSLLVAALSYFFVENPIRRSARLAQSPRATMVGAAVLIASCVSLTYLY